MEYTYDDDDDDHDAALALIIAFIVCVECAKEPEYHCENCDKTYKQEGRYKAHIAVCDTRDSPAFASAATAAAVVSAADFSELLRQNRDMMDLMRKQQETIQLLVAQLLPTAAAAAK